MAIDLQSIALIFSKDLINIQSTHMQANIITKINMEIKKKNTS